MLNTINAEQYAEETLRKAYRSDTRLHVGSAEVKERDSYGQPTLIAVPFTISNDHGTFDYSMDVWSEPCLNGQLYGEF